MVQPEHHAGADGRIYPSDDNESLHNGANPPVSDAFRRFLKREQISSVPSQTRHPFIWADALQIN
jgi:hypothetical protein